MKIRKALLEDAAEIANVHTNSWREAYKDLLPQAFLDDRPLFFKNRFEMWKKVIKEDQMITFVADSGDKHGVVGFVNGSFGRDIKYKDFVEVWSIYLLKKYHGQVVGFKLLKEFFTSFANKGYEKGYLWVLENNPSIKFYERTGAKRTSDTKKEVIGGTSVQEVCYVWNEMRFEK